MMILNRSSLLESDPQTLLGAPLPSAYLAFRCLPPLERVTVVAFDLIMSSVIDTLELLTVLICLSGPLSGGLPLSAALRGRSMPPCSPGHSLPAPPAIPVQGTSSGVLSLHSELSSNLHFLLVLYTYFIFVIVHGSDR